VTPGPFMRLFLSADSRRVLYRLIQKFAPLRNRVNG
jgi:hypothetical protein